MESLESRSENSNPNLRSPAPKYCNPQVIKSAKSQKSPSKSCNSPVIKSAKSQKSPSKMSNPVASPQNKTQQRKFVVAKKKPKKEKTLTSEAPCKYTEMSRFDADKCLSIAYQNIRVSQEVFSKNRDYVADQCNPLSENVRGVGVAQNYKVPDQCAFIKGYDVVENPNVADLCANNDGHDVVQTPKVVDHSASCNGYDVPETEEMTCIKAQYPKPASLNVTTEWATDALDSSGKRRRCAAMEEAREELPEFGSGRVRLMVKNFERLLLIPKSNDQNENGDKKEKKWLLPGLRPVAPDSDQSLLAFAPSDLLLTAENLGLGSQVSSSWDSHSHGSASSKNTFGGRSHWSGCESSRTTGWRNGGRMAPKKTSQKPFMLQTEERGRQKQEVFNKKIKEMLQDEQKKRVPIAQGLPFTTDEPQCLIKPEVKESTIPLDVKLYSDERAEDRAEFDYQVAVKQSMIEQYQMERERQQKMEEEEEIRRLRKELVPKALPCPVFDKPFMPTRSMKDPTIPRAPKLYNPKKMKGCSTSLNDIKFLSHY